MNIQHFEKGFTYSPAELKTVARKVGKIATYCKSVKDASSAIRVEVVREGTKKERDQVSVMITVELPEKVLRAESRKQDVIEALDRCLEKIEPQVKRYKERKTAKSRRRNTAER